MSEPPHSFEQLQRWMQSVLTHPGGVEAGAESSEARQHLHVSADQLDTVIAPSSSLSSSERLEIYSRAYIARLVECLRAEYPMLMRAVGQDLFDQFAIDYLQAHPSTSYTLSDLGRAFPQYLRETRPSENGEKLWPDFIIDLAELERLYSEIFDGPGIENVAPLDPQLLQQLSPESWPHTRLIPAPCLRLASFDFSVHAYYRRLRKNPDAAPPRRRATLLAITRWDYVVRPLELESAEHDLLADLVAGHALGQAIESAAGRSDNFETLAAKLPTWFERWMTERFFIAVQSP